MFHRQILVCAMLVAVAAALQAPKFNFSNLEGPLIPQGGGFANFKEGDTPEETPEEAAKSETTKENEAAEKEGEKEKEEAAEGEKAVEKVEEKDEEKEGEKEKEKEEEKEEEDPVAKADKDLIDNKNAGVQNRPHGRCELCVFAILKKYHDEVETCQGEEVQVDEAYRVTCTKVVDSMVKNYNMIEKMVHGEGCTRLSKDGRRSFLVKPCPPNVICSYMDVKEDGGRFCEHNYNFAKRATDEASQNGQVAENIQNLATDAVEAANGAGLDLDSVSTPAPATPASEEPVKP